jgi:hypothetical protein
LERGAQPLVELVRGDPALSGRLSQALRDPLAVFVRRPVMSSLDHLRKE